MAGNLADTLKRLKPPHWGSADIAAKMKQWAAQQHGGTGGAYERLFGFRGTPLAYTEKSFIGILANTLQSIGRDPPRPGVIHPDTGLPEIAGPVSDGIGPTILNALASAVSLALQTTFWLLAVTGDTITGIAPIPGGKNAEAIRAVMAQKNVMRLVGKFLGIELEFPGSNSQMALNWLNPTLPASPGEALQAFLANQIGQETLYTYCYAAGKTEQSIFELVQTAQERPDFASLVQMRLRGKIDADEFARRARELGWLNPELVEKVFELAKWVPDLGTVLQWLESKATLGGEQDARKLLTGFAERFVGAIPEALAALGIDEMSAKDIWAGHWRPVDLGTAFQLFQRLRPGTVRPDLEFSDKDLKHAIERSGVEPAAWEQVAQLAHAPISMRLIKGPFLDGYIDDISAQHALEKNGLSPDNAQLVVEIWSKERTRHQHTLTGGKAPAALLALYARSEIGDLELHAGLKDYGFTDAQVMRTGHNAAFDRRIHQRGEVIGLVKKHFVSGSIDQETARNLLAAYDLDEPAIQALITDWHHVKDASPREEGAGVLCQWLKQGLVSIPEVAERLARMRYSTADTARIIAACGLQEAEKHEKEAEKIVGDVKKKIGQQTKLWSAALKEAEKEYKHVEARSHTPVGRIISALAKRFHPRDKLGKPPPAAKAPKKGQPPATNGAASGSSPAGVPSAGGSAGLTEDVHPATDKWLAEMDELAAQASLAQGEHTGAADSAAVQEDISPPGADAAIGGAADQVTP